MKLKKMKSKKNIVAKVKIGVLVSGGGTNLQAIIDACESGILKGLAEIVVVISSRPDAYALERAQKHGIHSKPITRRNFDNDASFCAAIAEELKAHSVDLVCLAGFVHMISPEFISRFQGKILNIHPALLPKYGGKGMYGHHVHNAVIKAREKESGATVHWVDEHYDHGDIIIQKKVPVLPDDNCESLAKRVLEAEHKIYPQAILKVIKEKW